MAAFESAILDRQLSPHTADTAGGVTLLEPVWEAQEMSVDLIPCACGCGVLIPSKNKWNDPRRYLPNHFKSKAVPTNHPRVVNADGDCLIPLTRGKFAVVSSEDYERVARYRWCAKHGVNTWYAERRLRVSENAGKKGNISLHRFILDAGAGDEIDHKNLDGLDCRRDNLRLATHGDNQANRPKLSMNGSSQFKGVAYRKNYGKWHVRVALGNSELHVGFFCEEMDAARAYDAVARSVFGDFALINFPNDLVDWNVFVRESKNGRTGENHPEAKLTLLQVLDIRRRYIRKVVTSVMLAKEYGVTKTTILAIIHGRKWRE